MYNDVQCPYCGKGQDINHDDGYGYTEGVKHNQQCGSCGKTFIFETTISYDYDVEKADCLNGGEHEWKPTKTYPIEYTQMECVHCGENRSLTTEEYNIIVKPNPDNLSLP